MTWFSERQSLLNESSSTVCVILFACHTGARSHQIANHPRNAKVAVLIRSENWSIVLTPVKMKSSSHHKYQSSIVSIGKQSLSGFSP